MTFFDYLTHHALQHAIPAAGGALVAWLVARWPQKPPPFDAEFGSIVVRHGWGFKALSLVLVRGVVVRGRLCPARGCHVRITVCSWESGRRGGRP
jgi:hypothetical protein